MCGRYAFDDIEEIYEVRGFLEEAAANIGSEKATAIKTGEVFPSETAAVLAQNLGASAMNWGYPLHGTKRIIINARSESIFDKPMFRKSIANKKCLIPCTGFFEWQKQEGGKQKYKISLPGEKFFFLAGLFNTFGYGEEAQDRFVIITAPANDAMKDIHHRMPLIVPKNEADEWLESSVTDIDKIYNLTKELTKTAV